MSDGRERPGGRGRTAIQRDAVRCGAVYNDSDQGQNGQIQGDAQEAADYLNTAAAAVAGWHDLLDLTDNWVGLGQDTLGLGGEQQDILGFAFTGDDDTGTFTISGDLAEDFNQFAIGLENGGSPKWGIFMLAGGCADWELGHSRRTAGASRIRAVWAQSRGS